MSTAWVSSRMLVSGHASIGSWFRFDIVELFSLSLGCVSSGSYVSSLVVNISLSLVVLISISVGLVYLWEVRQSDHEDFGVDDGEGLHQQHLQELFDQFDADGNGITIAEMRDVVRKINPESVRQGRHERRRLDRLW